MIKYLFLTVLLATTVYSQNKKFTIEDAVINSYTTLAPEKLAELSWIPNSEEFSYVEKGSLLKRNSNTTEVTEILNLAFLNPNKQSEKDFYKNLEIKWKDENNITFWNDTIFYLYDISTNKIDVTNTILKSGEHKKVAPNSKYVAFTIDNNLYVSLENNHLVQITNSENMGIVNGQFVSRNEFGCRGGIFWSPKSSLIAFYQKDETKVTNYPLVKIGTTPAVVEYTKYPMTGQASEVLKIGVYDVKNDKTIWLNTKGEKNQYLTNVSWDPTEKFIYVAHLNRDQNHMRLIKYDAVTGEKVKILFEEKDNEYVEADHPAQFICGDDSKFVWFSERDGWQHLYLYNSDGKLLKQITKGEWVVKKIIGVDKEKHEIFIIASKDTPTEDHLYKVIVKTGEVKRLTKLGADHAIIFNNYNNTFLDTYTSLEVASVTQVIDADGNIISEILKSGNPISDYLISKPKIFKLQNENGTDLYSRIILPTDFDSTKTYPVVVYVYGGPHDQLVKNIWHTGKYQFWFQYMAQNGYIIFTLDNRGSANRGLEFEQAVFGKLGTEEIKDQLVGIEYLKSLSYVDANRIGVYGWSYGGFMTTSLMLRTNDTYKVGVGGGAVIDWKFYEAMYGERYMDTPQKNPKGYKESSLLNYVENLNGKLLLVHGTSDPTVVIQNVLEFAKKATNLNKSLDFYPYVGHVHGVKGQDKIHLYEKISNYFFENL